MIERWHKERLKRFKVPQAVADLVMDFVEEHIEDSHMESDFWAAVAKVYWHWHRGGQA